MATRELGKVKWFDPVRAFGFIRPDNSPDCFVHAAGVQGGTLKAGERVEFEVEPSDKGCGRIAKKVVKKAAV